MKYSTLSALCLVLTIAGASAVRKYRAEEDTKELLAMIVQTPAIPAPGKPQAPAKPLSAEARSLSDTIDELGKTIEDRQERERVYHEKNNREMYAVIYHLMDQLHVKEIEVSNKWPEDLTGVVTPTEPGKVRIRFEKRYDLTNWPH